MAIVSKIQLHAGWLGVLQVPRRLWHSGQCYLHKRPEVSFHLLSSWGPRVLGHQLVTLKITGDFPGITGESVLGRRLRPRPELPGLPAPHFSYHMDLGLLLKTEKPDLEPTFPPHPHTSTSGVRNKAPSSSINDWKTVGCL